MIGQCQARVLFQQKACICESKCLHERCFETNRLMTLVTSFLYKYLVSSKVNSEGINPLIRKSKVAKAESASGYCQTNKLSQLSGRWSTQNLLFSLIHVSKACLVLVRRERSLGLRAGHCQMCSQVSLSSLQRKQFQLFLQRSGRLVFWSLYRRGNSSSISFEENVIWMDFLNKV